MSVRGLKRRRLTTVTTRVKRPIDKQIIYVSKAGIAAGATVETVLYTCSFPCTLTGLRWDVQSADDFGTNTITFLIVVRPGGVAASTINTADTNTVYTPEENVLTWGMNMSIQAAATTTGLQATNHSGNTKTMRKLQNGDILSILIKNTGANQIDVVQGIVQFFLKS